MSCAQYGGKKGPCVLALKVIFLFLSFYSISVLTYVYAGGATDPPTLAGRVTPENGEWGSIFIFEVTYTGDEPPAEGYPRLWIDNETVELTEQDPADVDFTDGKVYEYRWATEKGNVGTHKFYFYTDDARDPTAGEYFGLRVMKRRTFLAWEVDDPKLVSGETAVFRGDLRTGDNLGVAGENLVIYKILFRENVIAGSALTDENGEFVFSFPAPDPGIYFYVVAFPGNDHYERSESPRLYVSTLNESLILGSSAAILFLVVGAMVFLLSRGMSRAYYPKRVLMGAVLGVFLYLARAGFLSLLAAGGVVGYMFARETRGWTKYLRVGCMTAFLIMFVMGILFMYHLVKFPELLLAHSITQADMFTILLYQIVYSSIFFGLFTGLAAVIGGVLRGGSKPQGAS